MSSEYNCGEEMLTIAAMTAIQVRIFSSDNDACITQSLLKDVFVIPDGAAGALAELERRKFTAEEGVCSFSSPSRSTTNIYPRIISPS